MPFPSPNDARLAVTQAVTEAIQAVMPNIVQTVLDRLNVGDGETPPPEDDIADDAMATPNDTDTGTDAMPDDEDPQAHKYSAIDFDDVTPAQNNLSVIVARQARQIQRLQNDLNRERTDITRYTRLHELSRQFAFDAKDEFEVCREMNDTQFARHCDRTVAKYARRDDVSNLDLPDDLEPDRYSGSRGKRISPSQIERFSREAATLAARKNATKNSSTSFEAEFDAICKQHGVSL